MHRVGMTLLLLHFIELWAVAWSCECLPEVTLGLWRSSAPNPVLPPPGCSTRAHPAPDSISGSTTLVPFCCKNEAQGACIPQPGVPQLVCDWTTKSAQFPLHLLPQEGRLLWPLSPSQLSATFQGLPELPVRVLEADLRPRTTNRGNLDLNPHSAPCDVGDLSRSQVSLSLHVFLCKVRAVALSGWLL